MQRLRTATGCSAGAGAPCRHVKSLRCLQGLQEFWRRPVRHHKSGHEPQLTCSGQTDHRMGLTAETSKLLLHMESYCSLKGSKLSGPPEACMMHAVYRDLSHCQYPAARKTQCFMSEYGATSIHSTHLSLEAHRMHYMAMVFTLQETQKHPSNPHGCGSKHTSASATFSFHG